MTAFTLYCLKCGAIKVLDVHGVCAQCMARGAR